MGDVIDARVLRAMRDARGWDQQTLARVSGVAASVISRLERGLQTDFKVSVLVALAHALDTSTDALLAPAHRHTPPSLSAELAAVVGQLAHMSEAQQRQAAAILRGYVSAVPE